MHIIFVTNLQHFFEFCLLIEQKFHIQLTFLIKIKIINILTKEGLRMKKSTKITYIWHRTLMAVTLVVSALGALLNEDVSAKSEYLFTCWQSAKFLIVSCLPYFLKKLKLDIPDAIYIVFMFYIVAHFICGEILDFYVRFKWWDSFLHLSSGMAIALLSFSFINLLNNNADDFKINIIFVAFFAFSMTVMVGAIWEIIEFASDSWFGTNMQRAYVSTTSGRGEALIGQSALKDTMKDLILDSIGAAFVSIICSIALISKKIKLEDLSFIKKDKVSSSKPFEITKNEQVEILVANDSSNKVSIEPINQEIKQSDNETSE